MACFLQLIPESFVCVVCVFEGRKIREATPSLFWGEMMWYTHFYINRASCTYCSVIIVFHLPIFLDSVYVCIHGLTFTFKGYTIFNILHTFGVVISLPVVPKAICPAPIKKVLYWTSVCRNICEYFCRMRS